MQTKVSLPVTVSDAVILNEKGYSFDKLIGEGSYGKVWLVNYKRPDSDEHQLIQFACKIIDSERAPSHFISKFLPREMDILTKINHPHLIHLHSIYQRKKRFFIFMRYAEKGDLLDHILVNGEVKENQARLWTHQLALGLQYLHNIEIVHRDIKCENVLITGNNNVKLADFGFSRFVVDSNGKRYLSTTYCGSLAYAAPELLKAKPYDPKNCDVWSLGIVLYVMLNQCMPFNDSEVKKLYELQMNRRWTFRTRIAANLSEDAKNLVRKMLQPDYILRLKIDDVVNDHWFSHNERLYSLTQREREALELGERDKQEILPKTTKLTIPSWKKRNRPEEIVCLTSLRYEDASMQFSFSQAGQILPKMKSGSMTQLKTPLLVQEVEKKLSEENYRKSIECDIKPTDSDSRKAGCSGGKGYPAVTIIDRSMTKIATKQSTVSILPTPAEQNAYLVPDSGPLEQPEVIYEENLLRPLESLESSDITNQ